MLRLFSSGLTLLSSPLSCGREGKKGHLNLPVKGNLVYFGETRSFKILPSSFLPKCHLKIEERFDRGRGWTLKPSWPLLSF